MDIEIARSSYKNYREGWNDCFAYLLNNKLFDPDTKQRIQTAMGEVVSVNKRETLTNAMAHQIDKEMGDE